MIEISRAFRPLVVVAVAGSLLTGCQTTDQETAQIGGGLVGAAVGGLIGSQFGSGGGQLAATALGTLAGAFIGSQIAAALTEPDRQALSQSTQQAAVTGESQTWQNPDTGVRGQVSVKETKVQKTSVPVRVLKDRVETIPPLELIQADYRVNSPANVRGGPGTDYVITDSLGLGDRVHVVGRVESQPWYMISEGGVGTGFVSASLLSPLPASMQTAAGSRSAAPVGDVTEVTVAADRTCRIVTQRVTLGDGSTKSEDVTVCNGPNGWEMV